MKNYLTPEIELIEAVGEDVIRTSVAVELPWTPLESGEAEL